MIASRLINLFVVLFSLTAGGLVVWQLARNLAGEKSVEIVEPEVEDETGVMPFDPKSIGGALDVGEHFSPDPPTPPNRPLLSGSKSPGILPTEAVTIPGIPPTPEEGEEEDRDPFAK